MKIRPRSSPPWPLSAADCHGHRLRPPHDDDARERAPSARRQTEFGLGPARRLHGLLHRHARSPAQPLRTRQMQTVRVAIIDAAGAR